MSSLISLNNWKYISKPATAALILYAYDVFVEGQSWKSKYNMYDAMMISGSIIVSKFSKDLINGFLPFDDTTVQGKIVEPLLNAFIYNYLYLNFMPANFGYNTSIRSSNINYVMGSLIAVIAGYMENP